MINCNGNENDNEKYIIYLIDLDVDMDTAIQNITCLGKIMSASNKKHLKIQPCKFKKHWYMIVYVFQKYPKNFAFKLFLILQQFTPWNLLFSSKAPYFSTVSIVFYVDKQHFTVQ